MDAHTPVFRHTWILALHMSDPALDDFPAGLMFLCRLFSHSSCQVISD